MSAKVMTRARLETGDRLTRAEFHRRYCTRPDIKKAELIEGVVYVASPARIPQHGEPQGIMVAWLAMYAVRTPGVRIADNSTVLLDDGNELQPDALLFHDPPRPGGAALDDQGYLVGAPDLVVEVAASTATRDLRDKRRAYERNGVREYLVWRIVRPALRWLRLRDGVYQEVKPDADGVIESTAFPGLRLHVGALLADDFTAVLAMYPAQAGPGAPGA